MFFISLLERYTLLILPKRSSAGADAARAAARASCPLGRRSLPATAARRTACAGPCPDERGLHGSTGSGARCAAGIGVVGDPLGVAARGPSEDSFHLAGAWRSAWAACVPPKPPPTMITCRRILIDIVSFCIAGASFSFADPPVVVHV